MTEKEQRN